MDDLRTLDARTRMDAIRDASLAASDARAVADPIPPRPPIVVKAMLARDLAVMDRANAAMRRFARTPMGRRLAR
jgi:hypothetical protein